MPQDKDYFHEAIALCEKISQGADETDFPCEAKYCSYCPYSYLCPGSAEADSEKNGHE